MMLDADVVAVSPSSVYRVLKAAGKLAPRGGTPSRKGKGFEQPLRPHEHWHVDVSYLNICGTFFFLCSILDGYSRFVVHWEIRETMKEAEVETILQRAREQYPGEHPRIITDNGPQFIARDFKEFIRICGMTHVKTSPYYPQSNGKIETLVQDPERRMHPRHDAFEPGGRSAVGRRVRDLLQHRASAQRDRLHHTGRQVGRSRRGDLGRAARETGAGRRPAASQAARRRSLPIHGLLSYIERAWAEDRATRGRDPSRPRGQDRCGRHDAAPRPTGIGPKAINPFTVLVSSP